MINARSVEMAILGAVLSAAPLIHAQDLKPSGSAAIQELALQPQLRDHQTRNAWLERR